MCVQILFCSSPESIAVRHRRIQQWTADPSSDRRGTADRKRSGTDSRRKFSGMVPETVHHQGASSSGRGSTSWTSTRMGLVSRVSFFMIFSNSLKNLNYNFFHLCSGLSPRGLFSRIFLHGVQRGRAVPLTPHEQRGCFTESPTANFNQRQFCRGNEHRPFIPVPPQLVIF